MTRSLPTHWFLFGLACAAVLPAVYTLDPLLDVDTWWHMAVGRWIVQNGDVPWIDPFSQMSRDNPTRWYAYSWYFDLWLYGIFHKSSYLGIIIFRCFACAVSTATMFAYLARRGGQTPLTLVMAFLTGTVLMMFAKERPWHFTITATTLTVWAVQYLRDGGSFRKVLWLMPLFTLWANIHIQFVYGWFPLGLACLFPSHARRDRMLMLTCGCVLATFLNPYHFRLIEVILEYALQSAPAEYINELAPPDWDAPSSIATMALLGVGAIVSSRNKPADYYTIVFLLVSAVLACRMRRDLWFAALAAIASLQMGGRQARRELIATAFTVVATICLIRIANLAGIGPSTAFQTLNERQDFVIDRYDSSRKVVIFNHLDTGGWLIWFTPRNGVSIDGRTNLYGDERIRRSFQTWNCDGDWKNDPEFINATHVFAPVDLPLTQWLQKSSEWRIHCQNQKLILFVRVE